LIPVSIGKGVPQDHAERLFCWGGLSEPRSPERESFTPAFWRTRLRKIDHALLDRPDADHDLGLLLGFNFLLDFLVILIFEQRISYPQDDIAGRYPINLRSRSGGVMGRERGDGRVDLLPRQGRWSVAGGATPGFRWRISSRPGGSPESVFHALDA
jgi:hypothetical protein